MSAPDAPPRPGTSAAAPTTTTTPGPPQTPPPTTPARDGWTAWRVVGAVVGSLMLVGSLGLGVTGVGLLVANTALRDADGFLMSDQQALSTASYAITSDNIEIHAADAAASVPHRLLGDARITVDPATGRPAFVGIARTADVARYLGGARHATLVDLTGGPWNRAPRYLTTGQGAPGTPPTAQDFWQAKATGSGPLALTWPVDRGDWTVVVMNANGTPGVDVDVAVGATVPALGWVVAVLLGLAAVGLVVSVVLLVLVIRGARRTTPTAAPQAPGTPEGSRTA